MSSHPALIASLDQGTSSTRLSVYKQNGDCVASHQLPTTSLHPHAGSVPIGARDRGDR